MIVILVLIGILAIVAVKYSKKPHKTDYYSFFIMGVIWIIFGIFINLRYTDIFFGNFFTILGIVYAALGLANKEKWKKNHIPFNKLPKAEQKLKMWFIIILSILLLAVVAVFFILGCLK